jgi:hypothetical protein
MQKEGSYIGRWREIAEELLAWGDSAEWNDLDFEKLSERFLHKTGTMLSITTLKRLWGKVQYNSTPNAATLNALAKFVGYDDWRTFKQNMDAGPAAVEEPLTEPIVAAIRKKSLLPAIAGIAAASIVLIAILAWIIKPKQVKNIAAKNTPVTFTGRVVAEGLPNSVVFDYDASALPGDSITLQQTWDPSRVERIAAAGKQHTSIYYYPGYFTAKLINEDKVEKETPVYIKTNGWMGIVSKDPVPAYLSDADIHLARAMGVTAKTFAAKAGTSVFNGQRVSFYNVREFGLNGGDFTLDATLRNTSTPEQSSCRNVVLYILGKQNAIIIPLANKGCISSLNMFTSSDWIDGRNKDLSAFGCDFNSFQKLSCSVKNMRLRVSLNDKQIFETPITQTIKDIAGLCISFEGSGEIKQVKLSNSSKVALDDDFRKSP